MPYIETKIWRSEGLIPVLGKLTHMYLSVCTFFIRLTFKDVAIIFSQFVNPCQIQSWFSYLYHPDRLSVKMHLYCITSDNARCDSNTWHCLFEINSLSFKLDLENWQRAAKNRWITTFHYLFQTSCWWDIYLSKASNMEAWALPQYMVL